MSKKKIIVLGSGLVGGPMARDLAAEFEVSLTDIKEDRLKKAINKFPIKGIVSDVSDTKNLRRLISDQDMVINAVPGHLGFKTLETVIESGRNVVDIAFFPEDLFMLDELAKEKGVTAISDIGVAPGMSNILTAFASSQLDSTEKVKIMVGGLPKNRQLPWEYKAVFSPADVLEEYTRPARVVRQGKQLTVAPLGEREFVNFEGIGTLEAFVSDGLRSLIRTMNAPDMEEKTLRYPGHARLMEILRDAGFFSTEQIKAGHTMVKPLDLTSALLFPQWTLEDGEADITVMQVMVRGIRDGRKTMITYDLYDEYDPESGIHSMARTTGYTATIAARMVLNGMYRHVGISPPEYLGQKAECVKFLFEEFKKRKINYRESVRLI
ncbi:MAG: saccharopine dehydrogenase C-terminal domain-containing protein [Bacteroidales bacterium]|nr:saccharopine dehydrogenase C-terminal domain-containing protein [Bacteroidales bacterium]